jgi:hypothetical protein
LSLQIKYKLRNDFLSMNTLLVRNYIRCILAEAQRQEQVDEEDVDNAKKSKFNKGDVAEGIFCAAIVAKFLSGGEAINENHVWDVIASLADAAASKSEKKTTTIKKAIKYDLSSEIYSVGVKGKANTISLVVGLSKANFEGLVDRINFDSIRGIVIAAINFASSSAIMNIIQKIKDVEKSNEVEVYAAGLENQKGTKVDIKISVDGKTSEFGSISLKTGSTKQLQQVGKGWQEDPDAKKSAQGVVDLFKGLFGIEIDSQLKQPYIAAIQDGGYDDVVAAVKSVYEDAFNKISTRFDGGPDELQDFLTTLAGGIKYAAVLKEEGVTLVQLGKETFYALDFNKLSDLFQNENKEIDIEVSYSSEENLPKIFISIWVDGESYDPIISVRPKIRINSAGGIGEFRHYVEKEGGLSRLIAVEFDATAAEKTQEDQMAPKQRRR